MTAGNRRVVLCSDHSAIALRQVIAGHIAAQGWQVVDLGPTTRESTPYPQHGAAAWWARAWRSTSSSWPPPSMAAVMGRGWR